MIVTCPSQEKAKHSGSEASWQRSCDELDMSQGGSSISVLSSLGSIWRGWLGCWREITMPLALWEDWTAAMWLLCVVPQGLAQYKESHSPSR